jgi:hypothetical protein
MSIESALGNAMETVIYELAGRVPDSKAAGIHFVRLEMPAESSPLALVWYTSSGNAEERGSRIDLQKQVFLDDFDDYDRASLDAEAKLIVRLVHSLTSRAKVRSG